MPFFYINSVKIFFFKKIVSCFRFYQKNGSAHVYNDGLINYRGIVNVDNKSPTLNAAESLP